MTIAQAQYIAASLLILLSVACSSYEPPDFNRTKDANNQPAPLAEEREKDDDSLLDVKAEELDDTDNLGEESRQEPVIRSSNGSGGPVGLNEINFTDSTGLTSSYKINAPEDVTQTVYGLHVHFHGDGGGGYRDFPNQETRYGLIGVTVRAPNQTLQWGRNQGVAHSRYANELIQNELLAKYNIDLDRIYFSGVSGGAYFLSGSFIPAYGQLYQSGAFLMCGAEAPRVEFADPNSLKNFRIHWQGTVGERQDIKQSIDRSVAAYRNLLDSVAGDPNQQSIEVVGNGGHCEFDDLPYTPGIQSMMDRKFNIILPAQANPG